MKYLMCIVVTCLLLVGTIQAQDDLGLELVSVQSIGDIVEVPNYSNWVKLSPNGNLLAYRKINRNNSDLCIYDFTTEQITCHTLPFDDMSDREQSSFRSIHWSPDSTMITFDSVERFSVIWIFNISSGEFIQYTEHDTTGSASITDTFPMWSPNNDLYFIRYSALETSQTYTVELFALLNDNDLSTEASLILDLTEFIELIPISGASRAFIRGSRIVSLDGAGSISPDGTKMALVYHPIGNSFTPESLNQHAILILDLDNGTLNQTILTTPEFYSIGLPDWAENEGFLMVGLSWVDSDTLVTHARILRDDAVSTFVSIAFRIELSTENITPIFQFNSVATLDALQSAAIFGSEIEYESSYYGVLTPDGSHFLYQNSDVKKESEEPTSGLVAIFSVRAASITGDPPITIYEIVLDPDDPPPPRPVATSVSIGSDEELVRVILRGMLYTFEVTD